MCNKDVYSVAGIHPQCAVKRQVDLDNAEIKALRKAAEIASAGTP